MESASKALLQNHNLRSTSCRQGIIEILGKVREALSEQEIKTLLEAHYDRTTIYRSFKTLVENHLIHKIVVDHQVVKYALNLKPDASHDHVHFYCNECEKLVCIESEENEKIALPSGFKADETEIIVKGKCENCNDESSNNHLK